MYDHYSRLRGGCGFLGSRGEKMLFKSKKAQSFVEFALILPILLLILLGVVELTLFIGSYINLVDLTREAARFASNRDYTAKSDITNKCGDPNRGLDFFYDTACIFSQLKGSSCTDANFCDGFNSTIPLKSYEDDILISVFTETGDVVSTAEPDGGTPTVYDNLEIAAPKINDIPIINPWVWSNNDADKTYDYNYLHDCGRLPNGTDNPAFTVTNTDLNKYAMPNKGFVVVEVIYCYHQVLNIPLIAQFLPNPIKIHTYTVMPLPSAQPTPTP